MTSKVLPSAAPHPKPPNAGKGRKKGVPNKFTGAIKDMVRQALEEAGGVEYLKTQAVKSPTAFIGLVGKLLPQELNAHHDGQVTLESLIVAALPGGEVKP